MSKPRKPDSYLSKFDERLRKIASFGVNLSLLTPLFFLPFVWHPFSAGKVWIFQTLIAVTVPAWVLLAIRQPVFRPQKSALLYGLGAQLVALLLSTIFAQYPAVSFWGTTDKMDGLLTYLHLLAFFLMAQSLWQTQSQTQRALKLSLAVGTATAVLALLQTLKPDLLGTTADVRISGTLGNPVFLGAYLGTIAVLALFWAVSEPALRKWALGVTVTAAMTLLLTGSRGGVVTLLGGLLFSALAYVFFARKRTWALAVAGVLIAGVAGYVAVIKVAMPHPSLASFWQKNANLRHLFETHDLGDRTRIWKLTLQGIQEKPLFGWGHGNYEELFDAHYVPREGCSPRGLNDPHNLVLDLLSTQGIIGLLAYGLLWFFLLRTCFRAVSSKTLNPAQGALLVGTLLGSQLPLLFNPESFSTLFLGFFLMTFVDRLGKSPARIFVNTQPSSWALPLANLAGIALALALNVVPAWASSRAVDSMQALGRGELRLAAEAFSSATQLPTPYLEEPLAIGSQLLVKHAEENSLDALPDWKSLFQQVRTVSENYLKHHRRLHFRMAWLLTLAKVGKATSNEALLDEAEGAFRQWTLEQPQRHVVLYAFGDLLASRGKLDEAEAQFQRAYAADAAVGEAHFKLGAFLWEYRKEAEEGSQLIRSGTKAQCPFSGYNVTQASQVAQGLFRQRDYDSLRALTSHVCGPLPGPSEQRYLQFAHYLEQANMKEERNDVLRAAMKRLPASSRRISPVLAGKQTVSELLSKR